MHGRQGFTSPVGRSIQSLDAMDEFPQVVRVSESDRFLVAIPSSAQPPNGHFVLNELATFMSIGVTDETLGRVAITGLSFSHYQIRNESEVMDLDDLAKAMRRKNMNKFPEAYVQLGPDGDIRVIPLLISGLGKTWDKANELSFSSSSPPAQVGAAIRAALDISRRSYAVV
jgi:hypothetical protein